MNKKLLTLFSLAVLLALPVVMLAANLAPPGFPAPVTDLWVVINSILNFIWPVFIGFAVIMFLVSAFLFVAAQGDPNKLQLARSAMIWGVIGVIVGIASFSMPYIIANSLNGG